MIVRQVLLAVLGGVAAGAVACSGGSSSSKSATSGAGGSPPAAATRTATTGSGSGAGFLIITKPEGLVEYDISKKTSRTLIAGATADTFLLDPALSPDYALLTYVAQPPPKIETSKTPQPTCPPGTAPSGSAIRGCGNGFVQTYDAGSDLWVANRDGSGAHQVFQHEQPNQIVRFPQWEDAGHILVVVQEIGQSTGITSVTYVLERIDIATGQRTKVQDNVLSFGVSPDHKRVAFAELAPQTGETLSMIDLADPAGTKKVLVALDQNLAPFNYPRFSPDGSKIAFASAEQTGARADFEFVSTSAFGDASRTLLDGLPEDIWTVDASGGTPARVADLKEDLPALTWDGTGKLIYTVGANGLYEVTLANGAVNNIGDGSFHAQVAWAP